MKRYRRILAEWTSTGTYQDRVNNIRYGTSSLAGTGIMLDGNVLDHNVEDVLTGSQGDDWFIWSLDDRATDLNDMAFEGDLDWILGL